MSSQGRRIQTDVHKLVMSQYEVQLVNDNMHEFYILFSGPKETPFENGTWKIHVEIPEQYPYKSPSIGFINKIFHPNIDENSGSVCLDVINQSWSPMFDLINVFEVFLPQLLRYPNPSDPLNGEAASLLLHNPQEYEERVRTHTSRHAKSASLATADTSVCDGEDSGISSIACYSDDEDDELDDLEL